MVAQNSKKQAQKSKLIAENRRARRDYVISQTFEAGLALQGSEVRSLRLNRASLEHAYAVVRHNEAFLLNADIPEYEKSRDSHTSKRIRKLLLHRHEINRLMAAVQRGGMTLVPLKLYFNDAGRVKILLGLARGQKKYDRRELLKQRDWQRHKARVMARRR